MEKIILNNDVAKKFCEEFNGSDWGALEYLRVENNKKTFLDWETECLLYCVISMNTILNDYIWNNSIDNIDKEFRPDFDNVFLSDLEEKYFNSRKTLLKRFSNIGFNEKTGLLEIKED